MASYSFTYDESSVTITVTGLSRGDLVKFYCRLSSETTADYAEEISSGSTCSHTFDDLEAETSYTINVEIGDILIGSRTFTTDKEPETGFYYYDGQWHKAIPYTYSNGAWKRVKFPIV